MTSGQGGPLSLSALIVHMRSQLEEALQHPASDENKAYLDKLWRTCIGIYNLAKEHRNPAYAILVERMVNAIADYEESDQPEKLGLNNALPSINEIEAVSTL